MAGRVEGHWATFSLFWFPSFLLPDALELQMCVLNSSILCSVGFQCGTVRGKAWACGQGSRCLLDVP